MKIYALWWQKYPNDNMNEWDFNVVFPLNIMNVKLRNLHEIYFLPCEKGH